MSSGKRTIEQAEAVGDAGAGDLRTRKRPTLYTVAGDPKSPSQGVDSPGGTGKGSTGDERRQPIDSRSLRPALSNTSDATTPSNSSRCDFFDNYAFTGRALDSLFTQGKARLVWTRVEDGKNGVCLALTSGLCRTLADALVMTRAISKVEEDIKNETKELDQKILDSEAKIDRLKRDRMLLWDAWERGSMAQEEYDRSCLRVESELEKKQDAVEKAVAKKKDLVAEMEESYESHRGFVSKAMSKVDRVFVQGGLVAPDKLPKATPGTQLLDAESTPNSVQAADNTVSGASGHEQGKAEPSRSSLDNGHPGHSEANALQKAEKELRRAKAEVRDAENKFREHEITQTAQREAYLAAQAGLDGKAVQAAFDVKYLAESMRLSQALTTAERERDEAMKMVQNLEVANSMSTSGDCQSDDEDDDFDRQAVIDYLDGLLTPVDSETCALYPELDEWEVESVTLVDPVTDISRGESRRRIDEWNEELSRRRLEARD